MAIDVVCGVQAVKFYAYDFDRGVRILHKPTPKGVEYLRCRESRVSKKKYIKPKPA